MVMKNDFRKSNFIKAHANWIIAAASFLVFLPLLPLKLWLIDDHEIVLFLTKLHAEGFVGFWHQWIQMPDFGAMPRFRPIYYVLRAIEILVWQDNTFLWVTTRLTFAFVFAVSIFRLMSKAVSPFSALLISLATLATPWLTDTLFRLGPSEAYAVLFVALLIFAMVPRSGNIRWLAVAACIAMLVGIKENFAILIPLSMWAAFALVRDKKRIAATFALVCVIFSISCVAVLAYKLYLSSGVDVYNHSTGNERLTTVLHSLFFSIKGWLSIVIVGLTAYAVFLENTEVQRNVTVSVFLGCVAILLFNLYFYSGVPSIRVRYAFPYWPIVLGMFLYGSIRVGCRYEKFQGHALKNGSLILLGVVVTGLMVNNMWRGYQYASATIRTDEAISQIIQKSQVVDEVVVIVTREVDYEPVFSIARFMAFNNLTKPLFLSVGAVPNSRNNAFSKELLQGLQSVELNGGGVYEPASRRGGNFDGCLEVVFHKSAPSACASQVLVAG